MKWMWADVESCAQGLALLPSGASGSEQPHFALFCVLSAFVAWIFLFIDIKVYALVELI